MNFSDRAVPIPFSRVFRWGVLDRLTGRRKRPKGEPARRVHHADKLLWESPRPSMTWIGHASVLIQMNGTSILTDPNWHRAATIPRLVRAGIHFQDLPPLGAVVVSHNHYDHLSMKTLRRAAAMRPQPLGIAPHGVGAYLVRAGFRDVVELDWWDHTSFSGIDVTLVPARHWSRRGLFDKNRTLWGGFVFSGERKIYFAGDTALWDGISEIPARLGPLDAALLPIGAYEPEWFMCHQHLNPEQAGEAFLRTQAKLLMAIHWGTFVLADEPTLEPPERLERWWRAREWPEDRKLWIPRIGETLALQGPGPTGLPGE